MDHQKDQMKAMQVMMLQQQIHVDEYPMLPKERVFELFKV
jgi:hypothetical protein